MLDFIFLTNLGFSWACASRGGGASGIGYFLTFYPVAPEALDCWPWLLVFFKPLRVYYSDSQFLFKFRDTTEELTCLLNKSNCWLSLKHYEKHQGDIIQSPIKRENFDSRYKWNCNYINIFINIYTIIYLYISTYTLRKKCKNINSKGLTEK